MLLFMSAIDRSPYHRLKNSSVLQSMSKYILALIIPVIMLGVSAGHTPGESFGESFDESAGESASKTVGESAGAAAGAQVAPDEIRVHITDFEQDGLRQTIENRTSEFLSEMNLAYSEGRAPVIRDSGISERFVSELDRLWETAPMYAPEDRLFLKLIRTADGNYEMRDIPLQLIDEEGEEVYEEAVLFFTPSGNLAGIRIALPQHHYGRIMREGIDRIDRDRRRHILDFTEEFRTAYNTKDIDFITKVFSDQALIVVGRVVQEADESSPYEDQVEYMRFSKEEYLERLERVFQVNRFIDVNFEDIRILRHPLYEDVYGVNMEQYYTSSTYSDEGYLFLLVDFQDPDAPMIHVRTWQPMRSTPEDRVFHRGDMEIF